MQLLLNILWKFRASDVRFPWRHINYVSIILPNTVIFYSPADVLSYTVVMCCHCQSWLHQTGFVMSSLG